MTEFSEILELLKKGQERQAIKELALQLHGIENTLTAMRLRFEDLEDDYEQGV